MATYRKNSPKKSTGHARQPFFSKDSASKAGRSFFTQPSKPPAIHNKTGDSEAENRVQAKLSIGQPDDKFEREADAVADRIVGQSETDIQRQEVPEEEEEVQAKSLSGQSDLLVQRQAEEEEEEEVQAKPLSGESSQSIQRQAEDENEEEELIQTKAKSTSQATASPNFTSAIKSTQGSGQALTGSTLHFFESSFGRDFGDVKIHTDSRANHIARSINARAFTHKSDVYFDSGEYQPHSSKGKHLLAHELTHVVQQSSSDISPKIQCDFAIAPTTPGTRVRTLTQTEIRAAIAFNRRNYTNPTEISFIRDVLGISSTPAVVDADFVNAVARYQAQYGLTQDGQLGLGTANRLAQEVTAEDDFIRSTSQQSIVTRGAVQHTGAVGAPPPGMQGPPVGSVEVRTGEEIQLRPGSRLPNVISIEYTGALTTDSRWLQFVWFEMTATTPRGIARLAGSIPTSSGVLPFTTNPASPSWAVDSGPNNPFYESGAASLRNHSSTTIFDAAGGGSASPLAQAVFGSGIGATAVTFTSHFDTYLIQNNQAVYVVPYRASTRFTPPAAAGGAINVGAIGYTVGRAGPVNALPNNLRTILHTNYRLFRNIQ